MERDNAALVRRYVAEVMNGARPVAYDDLVTPDVVYHAPQRPPGDEGLRGTHEVVRLLFPDMRYTIEDVISQADKVVVRLTGTGTYSGAGALEALPAGQTLSVSGIIIFRLGAGRIVEVWATWDDLGLRQQMGAR